MGLLCEKETGWQIAQRFCKPARTSYCTAFEEKLQQGICRFHILFHLYMYFSRVAATAPGPAESWAK